MIGNWQKDIVKSNVCELVKIKTCGQILGTYCVFKQYEITSLAH